MKTMERLTVNTPKYFCLLLFIFVALTMGDVNAELYQNKFASVMLGKKKIGHVHFTTKHDEKGILQELKSRTSLSILGLEVYHYSLHTHEIWEDGEMVRLWGNADDHGTIHNVNLQRNAHNYTGNVNERSVELPHDAFPVAVWHHRITQHDQLFSIPELKLAKVDVKKSIDKVKVGKQVIPAERFDFSGGWEFTLWFDKQRQFLKWAYKVKGKDVAVIIDP